MKKGISPELVNLAVGLLFASNLYFVKRLIDQVDSLDTIVMEHKQAIALINQSIENIRKCLHKNYGEKIPQGRSHSAYR